MQVQLGLPELKSRLSSDAICRERSPLGNGGASQGGALQDSPGALKSDRGASEIIMGCHLPSEASSDGLFLQNEEEKYNQMMRAEVIALRNPK